ncbi:MAG: GxxExxY protein [Bacteroidota bacterium]
MTDYELSGKVLACAFAVHAELGAGLLESVYQQCLAYELRTAGLSVETEKPLPVIYQGMEMPRGFRVDILVEHRLVLELKVVDAIMPNHVAQVLSYLTFLGCKYGLILNFMEASLKNGIKRVAL